MESHLDVFERNFEIISISFIKIRVVSARMFIIPKESKMLNFQSVEIPPELLMTASFSVMMIRINTNNLQNIK